MFYELVKWYDGEDQKASLDESGQKAFLEKDLFPAQKKQRLYLKAGILLDDLSNYTMLSGVGAVKKDGTLHKGMDGFCQEEDMVLVLYLLLSGGAGSGVSARPSILLKIRRCFLYFKAIIKGKGR